MGPWRTCTLSSDLISDFPHPWLDCNLDLHQSKHALWGKSNHSVNPRTKIWQKLKIIKSASEQISYKSLHDFKLPTNVWELGNGIFFKVSVCQLLMINGEATPADGPWSYWVLSGDCPLPPARKLSRHTQPTLVSSMSPLSCIWFN